MLDSIRQHYLQERDVDVVDIELSQQGVPTFLHAHVPALSNRWTFQTTVLFVFTLSPPLLLLRFFQYQLQSTPIHLQPICVLNSEFGLFAEEDCRVTAKSRRTALASFSAPGHLPHSPTSSVFSVPTTIHIQPISILPVPSL